MPEYIRALIVILGLSVPVFYFAKKAIVGMFLPLEIFIRRRNLWICIILAGFLSQNYWVFAAIVCLLTMMVAKKDSNPIALFFFICLALPQIKVEVPGIAGIRYILDVDYLRIITATILIPVCITERKKALKTKRRNVAPDLILAAYLIYLLILNIQNDSFTANIRLMLSQVLDIVIPYYAISRYIKSAAQFKEVFISFSIGAMLAAVLGIFEFYKSWILYATAGDALGVPWEPGYLVRGDYIRAIGTSGQAIVFGYVLAIAISLYICISHTFKSSRLYVLGLAILFGGVVAPLSKGPWVSLAIAGFFLLVTSEDVAKNSIKSAAFVLVCVFLAFATDNGANIISYLPFVGDLDEGSATYRQLLFEKSLLVIWDNPLFGTTNYRGELEELRNGQGIVDLVNTYIVIALHSGILGLGLFACFFALAATPVAKTLFKTSKLVMEKSIGRALIAALIVVMVTISIVSPIFHVPFFMWCIAAMCVAFQNAPANHVVTR